MSWPVWATNFLRHQKSPSPTCSWRMKMFLVFTRVFMSRLSLIAGEWLFLRIALWFFLSLALLLLNQSWNPRERRVRLTYLAVAALIWPYESLLNPQCSFYVLTCFVWLKLLAISWPMTCLQFHSSWFVCHYQKSKEKFIMHNTKLFILHTQLESCTKLYVHRLTVVLSKLSLETASCIPGGHELPLYSRTDSSALVGTRGNIFFLDMRYNNTRN